jgi:ABC-type multidrug transport system permease subunit
MMDMGMSEKATNIAKPMKFVLAILIAIATIASGIIIIQSIITSDVNGIMIGLFSILLCFWVWFLSFDITKYLV